MATLTHTRGDTLPLTLAMPEGALAATLQVHTLTACVEIPGSLSGGSASFTSAALDALMPGRVYRTTARITREGMTQTIDSFALLILEGCGVAPPAPSGIVLSGALVEDGSDTASGSLSIVAPGAITLSAALTEPGADTASGAASVGITVSAAMAESGADTASGEMTVVAPVSPLAQFYGTGAGQIDVHLPLSDPAALTIDPDGYVSRALNRGGAGAIYDATAAGDTRPRWTGAYADFAATGATDDEQLVTGASLEMFGRHVLFALGIPSTGGDFIRFAGQEGAAASSNGLILRSVSGSTTRKFIEAFRGGTTRAFTTAQFDVVPGSWALVEIRIQSGTARVWVNGTQVYSGSIPGTSYLINAIGGARQQVGEYWEGYIGDVVSVACDPAASGTSPEAATIAAREHLLQVYSQPLSQAVRVLSSVKDINQIPIVVTAKSSPADPGVVTTAGVGLCHPKVLHIPAGWNGYKYWMAMTPYFGTTIQSRAQYENPHILASNDGANWVEPVAGPLDYPEVGTNGYWSDTHIALDDNGVMHLWYRGYEFSFGSRVYAHRKSSDGVNWSARRLFNIPGTGPLAGMVPESEYLSPAIHKDGNQWVCYNLLRSGGSLSIPPQPGSTTTHVLRRTSAEVEGDFGGYSVAGVVKYSPRLWSGTNDPWHIDAIKVGDLYLHLINTGPLGSSSSTRLFMAWSSDGLNFKPFHEFGSLGHDAYRSSMHVESISGATITLGVIVGYRGNSGKGGTFDRLTVTLDTSEFGSLGSI